MTGKVRNYFAGGNTARGFHSLYDDCVKNLSRVFILKGAPGTGKSTLMRKVGEYWLQKGYSIEYLHCPLDNASIDGVLIEELKVGIIDGTDPHVMEPKAPGAIEEYVNLGGAWDSRALAAQKDQIVQLNMQIANAKQAAYEHFAEALSIHDNWESIYIDAMDFQKADALTRKLILNFFGNMHLNKISNVKHRFLGAATPEGAVDFVPNLTEDVPKRYFIKGRPGSGKSTMLKRIADVAENRGFDVEVYHCGFDPNSLDMVIVRELGIAIFDSTAPHEYFPTRDGDEIIDMYGSIIASGTDEIFEEQIAKHAKSYKEKMNEAMGFLAEAKVYNDQLESIYTSAMDFETIDALTEQIQAEIHEMEEQ